MSRTTDPLEIHCLTCESIQERANSYADFHGRAREVKRCMKHKEEEIEDGELCERCNKQEATEVYDGTRGSDKHVCHYCAGEYRMEE